MKIILKCPACHHETSVKLDKQLSSRHILKGLENYHYCPECEKNGLGKIHLDVIKFDWERKLKTSRPS